MPITRASILGRAEGAKFLLLAVGLVVSPELRALLDTLVGDGEDEEANAGVGLGHTLLYTNCSGAPLQDLADRALKAPFR
jgi:hypothetical protein